MAYINQQNQETTTNAPNFNQPFNGSDYDAKHDDVRLQGQIRRIYDLMRDGTYRTLGEIEEATGDNQASISAQLRHLRKVRFGAHTVNKRSRGARSNGLFEYQLIVTKPGERLSKIRLFLVNYDEYVIAPVAMMCSAVRQKIEEKHGDVFDIKIVSFTDRPAKGKRTFGEQLQLMEIENTTAPRVVHFD